MCWSESHTPHSRPREPVLRRSFSLKKVQKWRKSDSFKISRGRFLVSAKMPQHQMLSARELLLLVGNLKILLYFKQNAVELLSGVSFFKCYFQVNLFTSLGQWHGFQNFCQIMCFLLPLTIQHRFSLQVLLHLLFLSSVFDIYFRSPVLSDIEVWKGRFAF